MEVMGPRATEHFPHPSQCTSYRGGSKDKRKLGSLPSTLQPVVISFTSNSCFNHLTSSLNLCAHLWRILLYMMGNKITKFLNPSLGNNLVFRSKYHCISCPRSQKPLRLSLQREKTTLLLLSLKTGKVLSCFSTQIPLQVSELRN